MPIVVDILDIMSDTSHKSGLKMQCQILQQLCRLVETGGVMESIAIPGEEMPGGNPAYMRAKITHLLSSNFTNVSKDKVGYFVEGCFDLGKDNRAFKTHVRDFLIELKEFSGQDNADLFADEAEERAALARELAMAEAKSVPGLIPVSEIPEDAFDDV